MEGIAQVRENINEEKTKTNSKEEKGTSKRKTRGKTLCKKIHGRSLEEREEVTINEDGQPIGPTDKKFILPIEIRDRSAKEQREPTQAEIFFQTRKGNKGKNLDVETGKVIVQLQEMVENEESDPNAFETVFGKERSGRVRDYGRSVTKTSLKRKLESLMQHCNPQANMESIEDLLGLSHGDDNSGQKDIGTQLHSSTSNHASCLRKKCINEEDENEDIDDELFLEDDVSGEFQEDSDEFQDEDLGEEFQEDIEGEEF